MSGLQLASLLASPSSNGSSGVGLVVTVVILTVGAALVMSWLIGRLPEKNDDKWMPFSRRRRNDPFNRPPSGPSNPPPSGPFDS